MSELSRASAFTLSGALRQNIAGEHADAWDTLNDIPKDELPAAVKALESLLDMARGLRERVAA